MKAPESTNTARLILRKPTMDDAQDIFDRYASDEAVGEFLSWPIHSTIEQTHEFLAFSDSEWQRWPGGPYLIVSREDDSIVGGTGLEFETPMRASTGYVLAKECWGKGYASEALAAIQAIAKTISLGRLQSICHTDHALSRRVLEKAGFQFEGVLRDYCEFPNQAPGVLQSAFSFSWLPLHD